MKNEMDENDLLKEWKEKEEEEWKEELKNRLLNGHPMEYFEVVEFIDELLKSQREELVEKIKKMEK